VRILLAGVLSLLAASSPALAEEEILAKETMVISPAVPLRVMPAGTAFTVSDSEEMLSSPHALIPLQAVKRLHDTHFTLHRPTVESIVVAAKTHESCENALRDCSAAKPESTSWLSGTALAAIGFGLGLLTGAVVLR
jgi:hypothetical protein